MGISRLLTQPVTHHRVTGTTSDAHNNQVPVFADEETRGLLQQNSQWEAHPEMSPATASAMLFLLPDHVVGADDQFTVDGRRWDVSGPPKRIFNPRTRTYHHLEVEVRANG